MKSKVDCLNKSSNNKIIPIKGGQCQLILINDKQKLVEHFNVENCLISNDKKACDALILINSTKIYLVEFKGQHISEACTQIESTINTLKSHPDFSQHLNKGITAIVIPKKNKTITTSLQRTIKHFRKNLKCILYFKNREYRLVI